MNCHYFEFEKFHIPETISLSLHGFDFVVSTQVMLR